MVSTPSEQREQPDVLCALRTWILRGDLAPGTRLPVRDVARGLGVSTMPVREALIRLEETGFVTQERHKGAVVSRLSMDALADFYNLRRILEPESIQLGIKHITPHRLSRLRSALNELDKAVAGDDLVTVLDLDEEFLSILHAAVNNRELTRVIRSIWTRVRPYKLLFTTTAQVNAAQYMSDVNAKLLEATETGDGVEGRTIMDNSLSTAQLRLSDLLREHENETSHTSEGRVVDIDALIGSLLTEHRRF